jgi:transposase
VSEVNLNQAIKTFLDAIAAPLLARHGVGYDTAGALLCTAGDNPDRLATEASFASLCGTAPVPISSGNTQRRRPGRDQAAPEPAAPKT